MLLCNEKYVKGLNFFYQMCFVIHMSFILKSTAEPSHTLLSFAQLLLKKYWNKQPCQIIILVDILRTAIHSFHCSRKIGHTFPRKFIHSIQAIPYKRCRLLYSHKIRKETMWQCHYIYPLALKNIIFSNNMSNLLFVIL